MQHFTCHCFPKLLPHLLQSGLLAARMHACATDTNKMLFDFAVFMHEHSSTEGV
jgi:hypothetical protein